MTKWSREEQPSHMKTMTRCFSLDVGTDQMLQELSGGKTSRYLQRLIAVEFGKKLAQKETELPEDFCVLISKKGKPEAECNPLRA